MPSKNGFELQERDIELLHYTYQLRLATIDHLAMLSRRSVRSLWSRLHKLKKRRYLDSAARFMQKHVYAVGSAGVALLIEEGYAPQSLRSRRLRHIELTEIGIRHSLFVADIHARMLLDTRSKSTYLSDWQEGSALWDSVVPQAGVSAIPIRPDAYFVLKHLERPEGRNQFHIFLEADRSTMSHERMASKIMGFLAYYEQGLHTRKYPGMLGFLVAMVTLTRSRADELRRDLQPMIPSAARSAYLFISFEDLSLDALLPKAIAKGGLTRGGLREARD
ncbi:MAG TPA: replication-relaxation family protein [Bryobacteraceae bacterium]|jgi:hypothetical protein